MDRAEFARVIEQVKEAIDLVVLIGETVQLEPSGRCMAGRSPWHQDRNPSLRVWPHTQTWHDFSGGGGVGGDCISWVCHRDGVGVFDALRVLAARGGVRIPDQSDEDFEEAVKAASERREVERLLTISAAYYHSSMPSEIRHWIHDNYGLTDDTIDELLIGYADGQLWSTLSDDLGVEREQALKTALFVPRRNGVKDYFVGRVVFPYWRAGRVVYMIGRKTEHTPDADWERGKYKKLRLRTASSEYISAHISNTWFYNEDAARHGTGPLVITEGVTDCIAAQQHGLRVTSPVTTRFSRRDIPRLVDLSEHAERVVICNDNEAPDPLGRRPGLDGAIDTARALHEVGRDVRIAMLPRPEGRDKIDLCDYVREKGGDALRAVIRDAPTFPMFLIRQVPADTQLVDLDRALNEALRMAAMGGRAARRQYSDELVSRFGLGRRDADGMLSRAEKENKRRERSSTRQRRGDIWEDGGCYVTQGTKGEVEVSSFVANPVRRLVLDEGDVWEVDCVADSGRTIRTQLSLSAFRSRSALLNSLPSSDLQWTGGDDHAQGLLRLLVNADVETVPGSRVLGYVEHDGAPHWVAPAWKHGFNGVAYAETGASMANRLSYPEPDTDEVAEALRQVVPRLLLLNEPGVMATLIGWWFAAMQRPKFMKATGHFPFLVIHGTQGAGKTSLAQSVFWPLVGVQDGAPYSAGQTEFATLRLMSSTSSVPVVIDEYKPFAMSKSRRSRFNQLIHECYAGSSPERGRADQTTVSYTLSSPVCIVGETRPSVPALIERMITAVPLKDSLTECAPEFEIVRAANPWLVSTTLIRFLIPRDITHDLQVARNVLTSVLSSSGRVVPHRVRDNLSIMVAGLIAFEDFASAIGVQVGDVPVESAVASVLDDLYGDSPSVRSTFEQFIEELSTLAVIGKIERGREWWVDDAGSKLAIHFASAHSAFREHCRRIDHEGETPDRQSLRRQAREFASKPDGFVISHDAKVYFEGSRRRAWLIDLRRAKLQGLELDGFTAKIKSSAAAEIARWHDDDEDEGLPL